MPEKDGVTKRLDIHRKEITDAAECIKICQIAIGKHDERLSAYEANSKRQNGNLDELKGSIRDVAHGVNKISTKVDAMDTSIANREYQIERNGIKRDNEGDIAVRERADAREAHIRTEVDDIKKEISEVKRLGAARMAEIERVALESAAEHQQCAIDRIAAARAESVEEIAELRVEFLKQKSEATNMLLWKIISAASAVSFVFLLVAVSYSFHIFAFWP